MLLLTRRIGETLIVGDEVKVTVLGVKGNQVCLGINAPEDISVHREEIYLQIKNEIETHKIEGKKRTISSLYGKVKKDKKWLLKTG